MTLAQTLSDSIGPRLTGSPNMKRANEWTRDQLTAMGCSNAHLEDWGEFGMGWQQNNTWLRMALPDTAVFIVALVLALCIYMAVTLQAARLGKRR